MEDSDIAYIMDEEFRRKIPQNENIARRPVIVFGRHLTATSPSPFLEMLADVLRLQDETVTTAYVYIRKYERWFQEAQAMRNSELPPSALKQNGKLLDDYTLYLAALSIALKATESQRRNREILLPAWEILHPDEPKLIIPSTKYDALRQTLVQAEFILNRVLEFNMHVKLPYAYLSRFLAKTFEIITNAPEFDDQPLSKLEANNIVKLEDTGLGKIAWNNVQKLLIDYQMNLYPPRAIAVVCLWLAMKNRGYMLTVQSGSKDAEQEAIDDWLQYVSSRRVSKEEFWEIVSRAEYLKLAG